MTFAKCVPTVAPRAGSENATRLAARRAAFNFSGVETSGFGVPGGTATPATVPPKRIVVPSLSAPELSAFRMRGAVVISSAASGSARNF